MNRISIEDEIKKNLGKEVKKAFSSKITELTLEDLVKKVIKNGRLRSEFLKDPMKIAKKYGLSEEERKKLSTIDFSGIKQVNDGMSKSIGRFNKPIRECAHTNEFYHYSHPNGWLHRSNPETHRNRN